MSHGSLRSVVAHANTADDERIEMKQKRFVELFYLICDEVKNGKSPTNLVQHVKTHNNAYTQVKAAKAGKKKSTAPVTKPAEKTQFCAFPSLKSWILTPF